MNLGPTIYSAQYRISQVGDNGFVVETLHANKPDNFWPWDNKPTTYTWERVRFSACAMAPMVPEFKSIDAALKWVDDKRKYPIVVVPSA